MSIFSKLKSLFKKEDTIPPFEDFLDKANKRLAVLSKNEMHGQLISFSDANYTCAEGARICVGKHAPKDKQERLDYIAKVVGRGHESTISHSNIVMLITFSGFINFNSFMDCSGAMKFLYFSTRFFMNKDKYIVLIGGSIRAYKYLIRNTPNPGDNSFVQQVINLLYQSAEKEFFAAFIKDGIMVESKFGFQPYARTQSFHRDVMKNGRVFQEEEIDAEDYHQQVTKGKYVDIVYADNFYNIFDFVKVFGFTLRDVFRVCGCTVIFHDFSRSTSQQITRHFAGISQESQRYVNYSKSKFIDPTQFNPEKYPDQKVYKVSVDGHEMEKTAKDLGETLQKVYDQLIDQGMLKQDARGFLPFNVATKLMMTFTYSDLIHFFNMRIDKAAQPEVQEMAKETYELLKVHEGSKELFEINTLEGLISEVENPVYKQDDIKNESLLDEIDEPIGLPKEEIVSIEEDKKN